MATPRTASCRSYCRGGAAPPPSTGATTLYIRSRAVELSLRAFLMGTRDLPRRQVVSLGAGWDSLYFCLKDAGLLVGSGGWFFEVDLPEVASRKAAQISSSVELRALAGGGVREDLGSVWYSGDDYQLLGVDLSQLALLEGALCSAGLDPTTPTLILAEVVLPYMEVERSDALIQWAAGHFLRAWFILYEQIHPGDPFGRVMQNHFSRLQSPLRSLTAYPDCQAQRMRFLQRGWTQCHVMDMNEFYRSFVPGEEQERMQALEPFDEFESLHGKIYHFRTVLQKSTCPPGEKHPSHKTCQIVPGSPKYLCFLEMATLPAFNIHKVRVKSCEEYREAPRPPVAAPGEGPEKEEEKEEGTPYV